MVRFFARYSLNKSFVIYWLLTTLILLPFIIIASSLLLLTNITVVLFINKLTASSLSSFNATETAYYITQTTKYLNRDLSLQAIEQLDIYNQAEIKHLIDVHNVIAYSQLALVIFMLICIIKSAIVYRFSPMLFYRVLCAGGALTLALIAIIGIFLLLDFDGLFTAFHLLFFEGESWIFYSTDSLIQLFPESFWQMMGFFVAAYSAIIALAMMIFAWVQLVKHKKQ